MTLSVRIALLNGESYYREFQTFESRIYFALSDYAICKSDALDMMDYMNR